ncbi:hypothetical protein NDI43_21390 [Microcoleus vaginatus GB2-A3]|uniref:hypothetical protein n=1 Tax=Microcoleus vaginatus TaxID=119532 RepID=UPI0032AB632C
MKIDRTLKEEGRGKKEEGRGKKEEGRGKKEEGRGKKEEGRGKKEKRKTFRLLETRFFKETGFLSVILFWWKLLKRKS